MGACDILPSQAEYPVSEGVGTHSFSYSGYLSNRIQVSNDLYFFSSVLSTCGLEEILYNITFDNFGHKTLS